MTCSFLLSLIPRTAIRHIVGTIFRKVIRKSDKHFQDIGFSYLTNRTPDASASTKITRNSQTSFIEPSEALP